MTHNLDYFNSYVQHGDYDVIKDALRNKMLSSNHIDSNGCSVSQWAAVNNRFSIMNLLIDSGADLSFAGGVLGENTLHWAMRGRYYNMVELLVRKNKSLLEQRSKKGNNALLLAYELNDWNMMLLLLILGADPNSRYTANTTISYSNNSSSKHNSIATSVINTTTLHPSTDADGSTVLMNIFKHDSSCEVMPYVQLFLRFGADPGLCNHHGDTCFHVLASNPTTNLYLALHVLKASVPFGAGSVYLKNSSGYTAYETSRLKKVGKMSRFYIDAMMFQTLPRHTPLILSALNAILFFSLLAQFGIFYGFCLWLGLYLGFFKTATQYHIIAHRDRNDMGVTLGIALSWFYVFYYNMKEHVSENVYLFGMTSFLCAFLFAILFYLRKPDSSTGSSINSNSSNSNNKNTIPSLSHNALLKRILAQAPHEGTYEEQERLEKSIQLQLHASQRNKSSTDNSLITPHTLPLKLDAEIGCLTCLTDLKKSNHYTVHCPTCDVCVIDHDLHITFLGNCCGKGNRRYLVLFTLCSFMSLVVYIIASLATYRVMCPTAHGLLWDIIALNVCIFQQRIELFFLGVLACMICMAFLSLLVQELNLIGVQSSIMHFRQLGAGVIYNPNVFRNSVKLLFHRIAVFLCTGHYNINAIFDDSEEDSEETNDDNNNNANNNDDDSESQSLHPNPSQQHSKLTLQDRMDEFTLLSLGGGPEVDYADEDEKKERIQKQRYEDAKNNKRCCDRNHHHNGSGDIDEDGANSHSSNNGYDWNAGRNNNDSSSSTSSAVGPKLTSSMQMNFHDRV